MGALGLLAHLSALGVRLTREGDAIRAAPRTALTDEARTLIRAHKAELLAALFNPTDKAVCDYSGNTRQELFAFAPPGDRANDAESVTERAAIMAVENGWDDSKARQEARWQADGERCWRAFLRNAKRVLDAPAAHRDALIARYRQEAVLRYGEATGRDMTRSLRNWIDARRVH
jgi:hypothetical protein